MEVSVADLRYKMKDVLEALERRESVRILRHGKIKGTIVPGAESRKTGVTDHPFFGMKKGGPKSPGEVVNDLRRGRHNAL
jgi:antitoxin (DNA-binding transcriptional repressor) of toxin-antitoxin stability system